MSGGLDDADEVLALSRICRSPALAVSFIISPPRRRVGDVICLERALFAPRLASRALSVLNNNQGMRSRRARLLARVAAPNRSHTLAWHASDRGPRFSLSRGVRGASRTDDAKNSLARAAWPPDAVRDTFLAVATASQQSLSCWLACRAGSHCQRKAQAELCNRRA